MNIIETLDNFLKEHELILNKHVPYKVLQLHATERQDYFGLFRTLSIYCVSNNNSMVVQSNMRHDFYETSDLKIKIIKTKSGSNLSNNYELEFQGNNEMVNNWFEAIKNKYYLPHVNLEVLPKK